MADTKLDYLDHDIAVLTIDRPEVLNALNSKVIRELTERVDEAAQQNLRCLIVTGQGERSFSAGADVIELRDYQPADAICFTQCGNALMRRLVRLPVPVIAAVNGYAFGGGMELALACDIRIVSEAASFALPEVQLGIIPGFGGIQRLVRAVGSAKAREIIYTGDRIGAEEAWRIGLVNKVVPADQVLSTALELAGRIAANAGFAVQAIKAVANECDGMTEEESVDLEAAAFARCFEMPEQKQAMAAFIEKRGRRSARKQKESV